jgi:ABC-2 type transport system permease protein
VRQVYAELLKIRTAPWTTLILVLSMLAIVGLGAAGISNDAEDGFLPSPETDIIDVAGTSAIFALLLGILLITWEYRHGTITQTFLAAPRRERVVAAKIGLAAVVGVVLAVAALALGIAIAELWLGNQFKLESEHWRHAGRVVLGAALWAVLGLGLGATLQSQVGALILALVWFLVIELILVGLGSTIRDIGRYLPGEVLRQFAGAGAGGEDDLRRASAGLIAAAYAFGLAAIGTVSVLWRDVG